MSNPNEVSNDGLEAMKKFAEEHNKMKQPSGTCPHCGYCPTCGRPNNNLNWPVYPYYPYNPGPYYYMQGPTCCAGESK